MLEISDKHVVCGVLLDNGTPVSLYCHIETGDVAYESVFDGAAYLVGECTVEYPLDVQNVAEITMQLCSGEFGDVIGIILTQEYGIIIVDDLTAEIRPYTALSQPSNNKIAINMEMDYEEEY